MGGDVRAQLVQGVLAGRLVEVGELPRQLSGHKAVRLIDPGAEGHRFSYVLELDIGEVVARARKRARK